MANYSRKLDINGRIMIPIRLREEANMVAGKEYDFSMREIDGRKYICIDCGGVEVELEKAKQLLREHGIKVDGE